MANAPDDGVTWVVVLHRCLVVSLLLLLRWCSVTFGTAALLWIGPLVDVHSLCGDYFGCPRWPLLFLYCNFVALLRWCSVTFGAAALLWIGHVVDVHSLCGDHSGCPCLPLLHCYLNCVVLHHHLVSSNALGIFLVLDLFHIHCQLGTWCSARQVHFSWQGHLMNPAILSFGMHCPTWVWPCRVASCTPFHPHVDFF